MIRCNVCGQSGKKYKIAVLCAGHRVHFCDGHEYEANVLVRNLKDKQSRNVRIRRRQIRRKEKANAVVA